MFAAFPVAERQTLLRPEQYFIIKSKLRYEKKCTGRMLLYVPITPQMLAYDEDHGAPGTGAFLPVLRQGLWSGADQPQP